MIRRALQIIVAGITALLLWLAVLGTALCIQLWKDDHRVPLAILAASLPAGCALSSPALPSDGIAPSIPGDTMVVRWWTARPMMPTTMHAYIYTLMEECLGAAGDFWRIRWFSADFVQREGYERLGGLWIADPPRIVLDWRAVNDPVTVSHEILHDLLKGGMADHEDPRLAQCEIKRLVPVGPR